MNYVQIVGCAVLIALPLILIEQQMAATAVLLVGFTISENRIRNGRRAG